MNLEKLKKYLQTYLDNAVTPYVNNELVSDDEEKIRISVYDIKPKEHLPLELSVFLDIDPDWSKGSIAYKINKDVNRFMKMVGINKVLTIHYNKRPLY